MLHKKECSHNDTLPSLQVLCRHECCKKKRVFLNCCHNVERHNVAVMLSRIVGTIIAYSNVVLSLSLYIIDNDVRLSDTNDSCRIVVLLKFLIRLTIKYI